MNLSPEEYLNQLVDANNLAEMKLELSRVDSVWTKLNIQDIPFVYTVGGTNGKGTCCVLLEQALRAHKLRTGLILSPHLRSFNERIQVNGVPVDDKTWIKGLEYIENIRGETPLTYFEYCTLVAFYIFSHLALDVWILEVGLGGRKDAVNALDTDCAIITSIGLDHTSILGDTVEDIIAEKFPIARSGRPLVVGEPQWTESFEELNKDMRAKMMLINRDFGCDSKLLGSSELSEKTNLLWAQNAIGEQVEINFVRPNQPMTINNLATSWQALNLYKAKDRQSGPGPTIEEINVPNPTVTAEAWREFNMPGRWQKEKIKELNFILDCGHNPAAAKMLTRMIKSESNQDKHPTEIIFAIQTNKDWRGFVRNLSQCIDKWYLPLIDNSKIIPASELAEMMRSEEEFAELDTEVHESMEGLINNLAAANSSSVPSGRRDERRILVCGSFHLVGVFLSCAEHIKQESKTA